MIKNIAPKIPHQELGGFSTPRTGATDKVEVNSINSNNADTKTTKSAESMPVKEKPVNTKRHWTVPLTKPGAVEAEIYQLEKKSGDAQKLADNLLKYLRVGSNDSLNIMEGIFKFHRYDTTLLKIYKNDRTQKNLKALEIQIENQLFLGHPGKPPKAP